MSPSQIDRNLLYGFLALQNDFISREELIAGVSAYLADKSRPLDEILSQRRALDSDEQELVAALVRKHVQRHGNDIEKCLASLSQLTEVCNDLDKLGGADLHGTLMHVGPHPLQQPPATASQLVATLPVDGPTPQTGRFRILRPHAAGGLGQVFVALDTELNREVALKEIKVQLTHDVNCRQRFTLEAEINGGLEHPGIVPVYGFGQYPDGRPYYAMRFIRGDSLEEAIDRFHDGKPHADIFNCVDFRKLLARFVAVCNAMEYAHSRGVLHRDLKPRNIMLGKYGETLVVDWGLAKARGRAERYIDAGEHTLLPRSGSGSTATQYGAAIGTPAYMSPEQAAGWLDELGPTTDVYSLGATLYHILTGEPPFDRDDLATTLRRIQAGDFPAPRAINSHVPAALDAVCRKAMALKPGDRYASPALLAEDVERWLADEPVAAHRDRWMSSVRRWVRKHPRIDAALAATILIGLVSAVVISTLVAGKNQQLAAANDKLASAHAAERSARVEADTRRKDAEQARAKLAAVNSELRAAILAEGRGRRQTNEAIADYVTRALDQYGKITANLAATAQERADAYNEIAWLRATCADPTYRDAAGALAAAKRACDLTDWKNPAYLDTLAAAYAESSDFKNAIAWQTKAVDLAPDEFRGLWRYRLELYQAGISYEDEDLAPKRESDEMPLAAN
jgi:eukaryotic-like serine/threonine-protein kinase